MPVPENDHEGQMAKSELYRAAKYSMKLFQMIQDGQDLEGWVQAKITKSADYLDSVYHYMEYQVKFGDGSSASNIDDITGDAESEIASDEPMSDMDDEERKIDEMTTYEQKLEALLEGAIKEASGVRASDKKKGKVDKTERKQYFVKLEKDGRTKGMTIVADEGESQGEVRDRAARDAKSGGWTVASIRVKDEIDEAAEKISKAEKAAKSKKEKEDMVREAIELVVEKAVSKAQQKFMGMVHSAKKGEKPASKEVAKAAKGMSKKSAEDFASTKHKGLPEKKKKTDEGKGLSALKNLSPAQKGVVQAASLYAVGSGVQGMAKAAKGSNVPSPDDGATAAPPKGPDGQYPIVTSGPNKGKRWSPQTPGPTNPEFKESNLVKSIVKKVVAEKKASGSKPDFLDMDKDGDKKEPMKKAVADKKAAPFAKKDEKKESVNESSDLARMKQFLTRLNG
jgi:hypothetical protein